MVLSSVPSPQSQLESLQRELFQRNRQLADAESRIADLEAELARERAKGRSVERGVQQLRSVLTPLHQAIGMVFGEIDALGIEDAGGAPAVSPAADPRKSAVWDSWKQRLGGKTAEAIDVLKLHGSMNAVQLRVHLRCGRDYVYQVIHQLHKNGLIDKNAGKISLKEL